MIFFQDDDERYLNFLQTSTHRAGFILNTTRTPSKYAVLHRGTCHTIQGTPTAGQHWTAGDYRKIWASTLPELQQWASVELPEAPASCGLCHPDKSPAEDELAGAELTGAESAEGDASVPSGEVVIKLAAEGGGETIFRRPTAAGWTYWSRGSTMDFDVAGADYFRPWHQPETPDFSALLPASWPHLSLLQIHPEWRAWFREAYDAFWKGLSAEEQKKYDVSGSRRRRWAKILGEADASETNMTAMSVDNEETAFPAPLLFDEYPGQGRSLTGMVKGSNCRHGYGLQFMKKMGQTCCAYCGMDFAARYEAWLQMALDHVVPTRIGTAKGIPAQWLDDCSNKVLACSACNGFRNRYTLPSSEVCPATLDAFFDLRDRVFIERKALVTESHQNERAFFKQKLWEAAPKS